MTIGPIEAELQPSKVGMSNIMHGKFTVLITYSITYTMYNRGMKLELVGMCRKGCCFDFKTPFDHETKIV